MNRFICIICIAFASQSYAWGQSLVYHPLNPAFGGNTFNYSWLQSSAQAQDRSVDPAAKRNQTDYRTQTNTLENFAQSLQNQLLSRITRNLVDSKFGSNELKEGTYNLGDFQVEIKNGTDGVLVRIVDGKGGETTITVPYF
ncbi:curli production assembly/transport component CsgF [Spirosoma gilvum]